MLRKTLSFTYSKFVLFARFVTHALLLSFLKNFIFEIKYSVFFWFKIERQWKCRFRRITVKQIGIGGIKSAQANAELFC